MNRRTLISNFARRIHEIANYQAVKQYELKYAILDAEPVIYYGMSSIPRDKYKKETKEYMEANERMNKVMLTYDRIDRDVLIKRATEYLQNYELQYQLSQKQPGTIGSPDIDGMPKGSKIDNPAESNIVNHIGSQQYCDCIEQAIDNLRPSFKSLLYNNYIDIDKNDNIPEWDKLGISKATYYQYLKEAKYWFGITCSLVSIPLK